MTKQKLLTSKIICGTIFIALLIFCNFFAIKYFFNLFLMFLFNTSLLFAIYSILSRKLVELKIEGNKVKIYAGSSLSFLEVNGERIEEIKSVFEFQQKASWEKVFSENNILKIEIKPINILSIKFNGKIVKFK